MNIWKKLAICNGLCFIVSFFLVSYLGNIVNPILINYFDLEVERVTSNVVDATVNDLVARELDDDLFSITRNANDEVEMIDYNAKKVNELLEKINKNVYLKLQKLEEGEIEEFALASSLAGARYHQIKSGIVCEIPFGSLTGNGFLSNLGPIIPVKMTFLGQVSSSLKTKVTSYGINNLYLELYVHVEVKERISLPKSSKSAIVEIDAPLSIKIISGVVPDYYGGIIDKSSQATFFSVID